MPVTLAETVVRLRGRARYATVRALDVLSTEARRRDAERLFLGQPRRLPDRVGSRAFFLLSAREWRRRGDMPGHVAPLRAGLDACTRPERVLDLGTGPGGGAATAAAVFPDAQVVGVDELRSMIRLARRQHAAANVTFAVGRAEALPLADGEFDLVTMLNALPDVPELSRVASAEAEALIASTYFGNLPEPWVERLRQFGFELVSAGRVDAGSWHLFRRRR